MDIFLQILYASLATMGFSLMFNIEKRHFLISAIGGGVCWGSYLLFRYLGLSLFVSTVASSALVGVIGEVISALYYIPTSTFDIPACVPLIPGSNLYYAMASLLSKDYVGWKENTVDLALYAVGIATGLAIVIEAHHIMQNRRDNKHTA